MDSKIKLFPEQEEALGKLFPGAILLGDTGSGKTYTSLFYYLRNFRHLKLYVITTARKRNDKDWQHEALSIGITDIIVDSWNNIHKYEHVQQAFFIFDEQRVVGYGKWSKTFIKIAKQQSNKWILLTATPGDVWLDYLPVFIANGFYKNKRQFVEEHVEYNPYVNFPQVRRYHNEGKLTYLRNKLLIPMKKNSRTVKNRIYVKTNKDEALYKTIHKSRWNVFDNKPIQNASELLVSLRKTVNGATDRIDAAKLIISTHEKVIVFYNYNYELEILRNLCEELNTPYAEWNGKVHEEIPDTGEWIYLVQYTAGSEAWNCVETDTIVFYSLNYSYKVTKQAEGRIDRLNTTFTDLYYYYLYTPDTIDDRILQSVKSKKTFNIRAWAMKEGYNARERLPKEIQE